MFCLGQFIGKRVSAFVRVRARPSMSTDALCKMSTKEKYHFFFAIIMVNLSWLFPPKPQPPPSSIWNTVWRLFVSSVLLVITVGAYVAVYVANLKDLNASFVKPLTQGTPVMSSEDSRIAFPPAIEIISQINGQFLEKLEQRIRPDPRLVPWAQIIMSVTGTKSLTHFTVPTVRNSTCVGDIFAEMSPYFKSYVSFVNNFDESRAAIKRAQRSSKTFRDFVERPGHQIATMESEMISIVQRLPRYILLIQELIKTTDDGHPDKPHLQRALQLVKEVTFALNDNKRVSENQMEVLRLERKHRLEHSLTRTLIRKGNVVYGTSSSTVNSKPVEAYLFSDIFVLVNEKKVEEIPVKMIDFPTVKGNGFCMNDRFYATADAEPSAWVNDINEAIAKLNQNKSTFIEATKRATLTPELVSSPLLRKSPSNQ
ncbi:hypothetical protein PROFUN_10301 [Planoprotostelium fungivorum]|uniref:DH domain-containing protein n=1 Tax=Planoprotostelium fungivorum TaxID=1890364 RepID=A0A2P6MRU0_9EUKA|nr:hypothetical protein PROFUN_10301 [Planoprotostelium fungivorum]